MPRASGILGVTTILALVAAIWFYAQSRALKQQLADATRTTPAAPEVAPVARVNADESHARAAGIGVGRSARPPELAPPIMQSWLDRRLNRQQELSAMFGRGSDETDDAYRARIVPLVKLGLARPRQHAEEMRKAAEDKAHVTAAQSQQLDQAFQKTFGDALAYANKAIADGTVSPYEPSIAGLLEFGGGLGSLLQDANSQIGHILTPDQIHAMNDSGFDWGQYLGLEIPWEQLTPPPPPKQ